MTFGQFLFLLILVVCLCLASMIIGLFTFKLITDIKFFNDYKRSEDDVR